MNFLFHTAILFNKVPVYYNIYKDADLYFAEVLDNPNEVINAINFSLKMNTGKWICSIALNEKQIQTVVEEIKTKEV
jgi:hypothetical protein